MTEKPTNLYHLTALAVFASLKAAHSFADNEALAFLLRPTDTLVGWALGSRSVYRPESGYFHVEPDILIDKSCSGFNFWLLCFVMLVFTALPFAKSRTAKTALLPAALFMAYMLALWANVSRILLAVLLNGPGQKIIGGNPDWLHQAEGVFVYLSFLIAVYLCFDFLLRKLNLPNAQPSES